MHIGDLIMLLAHLAQILLGVSLVFIVVGILIILLTSNRKDIPKTEKALEIAISFGSAAATAIVAMASKYIFG
jgi:hypothetical protein